MTVENERSGSRGARDCRSDLVAVAVALFAEKGFNGVSVREMATAAGANVSMISYYFGGKEGLYEAVLRERFAVIFDTAGIAAAEGDPLAKLELYVRSTVDRYRSDPYLLRFYTSELTNPTACFATIVKPAIQGVIRLLRRLLEEGVARGLFRQGLDPTDTALAVAGMINFYFLLEPATRELLEPAAERDEELVRRIMDLLGKGILRSGC